MNNEQFKKDCEEFTKPIAKLIRVFPVDKDPTWRYTQEEYRTRRRAHIEKAALGKTYAEYLNDCSS
jgi:hypothetical protein